MRGFILLLKKHNRLWGVIISAVFFIASIVVAIIAESCWGTVLSSTLACMWLMNVLYTAREITLMEDSTNGWALAKSYAKENRALVTRCEELDGKLRSVTDERNVLQGLTQARRENPIKSNRIVGDKTFAIRLKNFVKDVTVCDACSEDEKDYLLRTAESLLKWQIKTVRPNTAEAVYLENIGLLTEPAEEKPEAVEEKTEVQEAPDAETEIEKQLFVPEEPAKPKRTRKPSGKRSTKSKAKESNA